VEVQENLGEFEQRGLRVIAIGQGSADEARSFCDKWGVAYPCLGDPDRRGYEAMDLGRGNWWTLALRSLLTRPIETVKLTAQADVEGSRLASTDVFQLGGVVIIDREGTMRAIHRAQSPEDMPSVEEVLGFDWQGAEC